MRTKFILLLTLACSLLAYGQPAEPSLSLMPQAGHAFWCDSIPAAMRQSYIRYGEQYLGRPWTVLPWTVFAENKINGNRVNYEAVCFEKRRQLAALVMAEIIEGKGRFLDQLINGVFLSCEMTSWALSAHMSLQKKRVM